jgi:hypothetical protein
MKIPNTNQLFINNNSIGFEGCDHLRNAKWFNLGLLNLSNKIIS